MPTHRDAWLQLWQASGADPDASPMWAEALVAGHQLPAAELFVLVAGPLPSPTLVWPFRRRPRQRWGLPWYEVMPLQNVYCCHAGVLSQDDAEAAVRQIQQGLAAWSKPWHWCQVEAVVANGELHRAWQAAAGTELQVQATSRSPFLAHAGSFDALLAQRSRNFREKARARLRDLHKLPGLQLQRYTEAAELPAYLAQALVIERKSWKHQEGSAISSRQWEMAFYEHLLQGLAPFGLVAASVMLLDGQPIAHSLDLCHRGRVFGMKWSYDLDHGKLRPGVMLTTERLARYFDAGCTEFDFLGEDDPYKLQWTSTVRQHVSLRIHADSIGGRLARLLDVTRGHLRRGRGLTANLAAHRLGDVTRLVGRVMQRLVDQWRGRAAGEQDARPQQDLRHRHLVVLVPAHQPDGIVRVLLHHPARLGGQAEEPQHVATGQRRHQRFLGIDRLRVREGQRHRMRR